jgi:hypothetical protein
VSQTLSHHRRLRQALQNLQGEVRHSANFRGVPHVPGIDFALAVPDRGGKNDGESMN